MEQKVWLVTGASRGLGLALVRELLSQGHRVAATSRTTDVLVKEVGAPGENFLPVPMDLVNESSVQKGIDMALAHFGVIDVVVNNAGYGQIGTLEELSDEECRMSFDVNVFGVLHITRHIMPHFRARHTGYFFNISSIGGYTANFPGWGIYCATKYALAALTESLAAESKEFGVKATAVYPGFFKTNFLGKGSLMTPRNPIADYKEARKSQVFYEGMNGQQQGDPQKAAQVLIRLSAQPEPPLHLFLGADAYEVANTTMASIKDELERWKEETISTAL